MLLVWLRFLSGHLFEKNSPIGWSCYHAVFCLFVISRFGFR